MQAVNNHNSSGSTRIRAMEQQSTAVPHTDRRFTTEDFRNLFSYARHGKYKQVSCHRQQTRHLFVNLIILFSLLRVKSIITFLTF